MRIMRIITGIALYAVLAGCGGLPQLNVPKEVKVEVLAPCVKAGTRPQRPPFRSQEELDLMPDYAWGLSMEAERIKALAYVGELEAVVEGCSRIPALPAATTTKEIPK